MNRSKELFDRAVKHLPGGVNSPVRAYHAVGGHPRFIDRAEGAYIYDVDGMAYIDYICSWGAMILGHNHEGIRNAVVNAAENGLSFGTATEKEVIMAELLCELIPSFDMVRMVNSGTEAVMSAVRVARGYTKRDKIIKFEGCYHGHSDGLLIKAGSGVLTGGVPDSAGVPECVVKDTLSAVYNNLDSVAWLFEDNKGKIAAVIVEPVAANMGVVLPEEGFLEGLRELCTREGAVLIFDEVITGFRLGITGAQGYYKVTPDLTTFGKIIGGGMPVGCYGGKREIMELIAPIGGVYQAGTLSGNPIAMAAGIAQLRILKEHPEVYALINKNGEYFRKELAQILRNYEKRYQVLGVGSLSCLFFTGVKINNYLDAKTSDVVAYRKYFNYMLSHGIHLAPSQFEAMFLTAAHKRAEIDTTLEVIEGYFKSE